MAQAERKEVFNIDRETFFKTISDFASYPDFVDGVDEIKILEESDSEARVEYSLNLIKKFSYILKLKKNGPEELTWTLESGDIFKKNNGGWYLKDLGGGKTEVTYKIEVDLTLFAPKMIVNKLVGKTLPKMMESFFERARRL
jgi:coenzyme Q-binding protein COQ10